jgi:hypothetical protein
MRGGRQGGSHGATKRRSVRIRAGDCGLVVRAASTGWHRDPIRSSEEARLFQIDRKSDGSAPVN